MDWNELIALYGFAAVYALAVSTNKRLDTMIGDDPEVLAQLREEFRKSEEMVREAKINAETVSIMLDDVIRRLDNCTKGIIKETAFVEDLK